MNNKQLLSLTNAQKRIWFQEKSYLNTKAVTLSFCVTIEKNANFELLQYAINQTLLKHDSFRLRFLETGENQVPMQYVADFKSEKFDQFDFTGKGGLQKQNQFLDIEKNKTFNLIDNPLYYIALVKYHDHKMGYFFRMNHLIMDGWTVELFIYEVKKLYQSAKENKKISEIKKVPSYIQYIEDEKKYLASADYKRHKKFWLKEFSTMPQEVNISISENKAQNIKASSVTFIPPPELFSNMLEYAKQHNVSSFKQCISAIAVYINKLKNLNDFCIGTVNHNRSQPSWQTTAGMFVSTFPLRFKINQQQTFLDFAKQEGDKLNSILKDYQAYPFNNLATELREKTGVNPGYLLNIMVVGHPDGNYDYLFSGEEAAQILVHLFIDPKIGLFKMNFIYNQELFNSSEIEAFYHSICTILNQAISNKNITVNQIQLISKEEEHKIISDFNNTDHALPEIPIFQPLFEKQAKLTPDAYAVICKDKKLTYKELNEKANVIAHQLRSNNAKADSIIGIYMDRSADMIISLLGVIKSGAAYLPIDQDYPKERVKYMLDNSKALLLLSKSELISDLEFTGETLLLNKIDFNNGNTNNPKITTNPHDLFYIIYTSGSTGKPKGVMIEHRSVVNFALWKVDDIGYKANDQLGLFPSFGFDIFGIQVFAGLISGGTIHVITDDIRLYPIELNRYFEKNKINHIYFPTQFGENFMDLVENHSLETFALAGEKLRRITENRPYKIYNEYGPTEATILATSFLANHNYKNIPIGKPIWNYKIVILGSDGEMMPIGLPGELCILGIGLARGYLFRPELTAEKFCDCPALPGSRMYKTGDLARWLPDGNIECLGRIDSQVKIRGFRVELGEIETAIKKCNNINEVVVVDVDDPSGGKFLCAYYIADEDIDTEKIKTEIGKTLPNYMVPEFFVKIKKVPLTPNGKIDRKELPSPHIARKKGALPSTKTEKIVAQIWEEVLKTKKLNVDDNFFEIGGQSLVAAVIQTKIQQKTGIAISLHDIFNNPTIAKLSQCLNKSEISKIEHILPAKKEKYYPLTPQQLRLFVLNQMEGPSITYNIIGIWNLVGNLDVERFSNAIDKMVELHSVLRTSFKTINNQPVQCISPTVDVKKVFVERPNNTAQEIINEFVKPFQLDKSPLFRVFLAKTKNNEHIFLFDAHHIIIDGLSQQKFITQLFAIYRGIAQKREPIEYTDYAIWYDKFQKSEQLEKEKAYWKKTFEGELPSINLPIDFPRPTEMDFAGKQFAYHTNPTLRSKLKKYSAQTGITLFNLLLSAYGILLKKYSGSENFVVGIPSAGRTNADTADMLGMFVNTLPIKMNIFEEETIKQTLKNTSDLVGQAIDNQDFQLDKIVDMLNIPRSSGRNPLVEVMFTFIPEQKDIVINKLEINRADFQFNISKFDLTLHVIETDDHFKLGFEYRTALFNEQTMQRMAESFTAILEQICDSTTQKLTQLNIVSNEEKKWLLYDYNNTKVDYPKDKSVIELFEQQVIENPTSIAVEFKDEVFTYSEINKKANILAHKLRKNGVKPNKVVGIMMDRSPEVIVSFLAVNKAGGAYVPIDPEYPSDRVEYILANSETDILLTKKIFADKITFAGKKIFIDFTDEELFTGDDKNPSKTISQNDLVYLIYTSGSTGKPKGVMLTHLGLTNYICWAQKEYLVGEKLTFPLYSSISFDLTVTSIFTPLTSGCKIVIYSDEDKSMTISRIVRDKKAEIVKLTPTHLKIMENEELQNSTIKRLIVGGEELQSDLAKRINKAFGGNIEILNEYGPTETVVGCMIHSYNPINDTRTAVPIGVPADNARIYLLDENLKLVPKGVVGEMYIAGDGVARGYMNKPDITAERFINDPFFEGERMYKAGDLARFAGDVIEYLGRVDFQVKIHGFRIELNEIETRLRKHQQISDLAVVARDDSSGDKFLCAYYVSEKEIKTETLKEFVKAELPDYMVPAWFVKMDEIPLTPNGKTDTKNLPDPSAVVHSHTIVEAQSEKEQQFIDAFKKVLNIKQVSVNDNFFDIGGNSLKAVTLTVLLQKKFDINVNDIFSNQTPKKLAKKIVASNKNLVVRLRDLKDSDIKYPEWNIPNAESKNKISAYKTKIKQLDKTAITETLEFENILLTGSTGFLGIWLLKLLLSDSKAKIYLPIRADSEAKAIVRLLQRWEYYFPNDQFSDKLERLEIFCGDLEKPHLGVTDEQWKILAAKVDCIINPAANVRHYGAYEAFYKSNVGSVEHLLELCKTGKPKILNHVSTISIGMGTVKDKEQIVFTEYDLDINQQSDNVYLKTKLEAEKKIIEAQKEGINANIFRIGNITFDSENGKSQQNLQDNGFYQVLNSLINIGAVPHKSIAYEFSFVNQVAEAILKLYNRKSLLNNTWHIQNPHSYFLEDILKSPELGLNIRSMSLNNFLDLLIEDASIDEFANLVDNLVLHRGLLDDAIKTDTIYENKKTNAILNKCGFHWHDFSVDLIKNLITETLRKRINFFSINSLFKNTSVSTIETLAAKSTIEYYQKNADIVTPGTTLTDIIFVKKGFVEFSQESSAGWVGTISVLKKGDVYGISKLFSSGINQHHLTAVFGDTVILKIPIAEIEKIALQNNSTTSNIIELLGKKINDLTELFIKTGNKTGTKR